MIRPPPSGPTLSSASPLHHECCQLLLGHLRQVLAAAAVLLLQRLRHVHPHTHAHVNISRCIKKGTTSAVCLLRTMLRQTGGVAQPLCRCQAIL